MRPLTTTFVLVAVGAAGVTASGCNSAGEAAPGDPTEVAKIDALETEFDTAYGDSYSFLVNDRGKGRPTPECDLREARIVVVDGVVTDAVSLPTPAHDACRIDIADAPTAADLFDTARSLSGVSDFDVGSSPEEGIPLWMSATDDGSEVRLSIESASPSTAPTSAGWNEVRANAAVAEDRWEQQSFDHVVTVDPRGFSELYVKRATTVVDGVATKTVEYSDQSEQSQEVDPRPLAEFGFPLTVNDVFDIIEEEDGSGYVAAVFDLDTGVPTSLWFDPHPGAVDDEYAVFTSVEKLDPDSGTSEAPPAAQPATPSATFAPPTDSSILTRIDDAEADLLDDSGESYSYFLSTWDSAHTDPSCGLDNARIVVEQGEVTDAVGLPTRDHPGCHIDPSEAPTLAELFDTVRSVAGASEFDIDTRPIDSTVLRMTAADTDFGFQLAISDLSSSTSPTSIGWDEVRTATAAAKERWARQSFDYTIHIYSVDFLVGNFDRATTVVGGEIVAVTENGTEVDPSSLSGPWPPYTVDDLFAILDTQAKVDEGNIIVVFDAETGVPSILRQDPIPGAADDELTLSVTIDRL